MDYTYDMYCEGIDKLAESIYSVHRFAPFGYVCGIARGGLIPATHLSYKLNLPLLTIAVDSKTGEVHYEYGFDNEPDTVEHKLRNSNVLIVDDIIDSGKTVALIENEFWKKFKWAVLVHNLSQPNSPAWRHVWIDRNVDKEYVTFWWEKDEVVSRYVMEKVSK